MDARRVIDFMGVRVDVLDTRGLRDRVLGFALNGAPRKVMYVNADCILLARRDPEYRTILNRADLVYADGVGVVWGARLWGDRLPGRSTAADFMPDFCRSFAGRGLRLFLLGAKPGVAEQAAARLRREVPELRIAGTHHGYFQPEEQDRILDAIREARPHILLVGFGAPHQERWIEANLPRLRIPVVWGVGGLFDFLSERTRRGPQWLLDHGFEWLCRLAVEPRRLGRRYLLGNLKFIFCLFWHRFVAQRAW